MQSVSGPGTPAEPSESRGANQGSTKSLIRRRTVVAGAAWSVPAVIGINAAPAWAAVSPVACPTKTFTNVRGAGRFLGGTLLGTNLDTIADISGVTTTSNGTAGNVTPDPAGATRINGSEYYPYAYSVPLSVGVINDAIGVTLAALLDLNTDLGAVNQYARSVFNGNSAGGSGLVDESSGAISFKGNGAYPSYAKINVRNLVASVTNSALASALADVADVTLDVGAVAARAAVDTCASDEVTREYLVAWVKTIVKVPAVASLLQAVNTWLGNLPDTLVNGVTGPGGAVATLLSGLQSLLNPILHVLGLHLKDLGVEVTLDSSTTLNALLANQLTDNAGVLTIDLSGNSADAVTVDTGALLGYPWNATKGSRLSNLAPNTELAINSTVINSLLKTTLTTVLQDWLDNIVEAVKNVVNVKVTLNIVNWSLTGGPGSSTVAKVEIAGSLSDLLNGTFTTNVTLGNATLLNDVLSAILGATGKGLLNALGSAIGGLISSTLTTATSGLVTSVVDAVDNLYTALYASNILSLMVNVQNGVAGAPTDWDSIPADQYDVAALRLSVLDAASVTRLYLARASVGANTYTPIP